MGKRWLVRTVAVFALGTALPHTAAEAQAPLEVVVTPVPMVLPDPDTYTEGDRVEGDALVDVFLMGVIWQSRGDGGIGTVQYQGNGTVSGVWNEEAVNGIWYWDNTERTALCTEWEQPIIRGGHMDCYWIHPKIDNETGEILGYTVDGSYTP